MTNTHTLKPVAYFRATKKHGIVWGDDCCCEDAIFDGDDNYAEQETFSLPVYSSDVVEALQKENAELKEINESLHSSSKFTYGNQKSEIESLRKQLEELKNAATFASSALAHASNNDPLYNKAYLGLREVLFPELKVISAASKNGE